MEDQQFILRWHYHETTLLRNLPHLLESEILTDITLSADNQIVKAHRIVLASCSSYFLQLFQNVGSLQHPVIILHNTSYNDLKSIISFIYRGQCLITRNQLPGLLSLAKLLQIQGLCDMKNSFHFHPFNSVRNLPRPNSTSANHLCLIPVKALYQIKTKIEKEENTDSSSPRKTTKDLLFKCFLCGKYLSNQYNLRVHMETHEEGCYMCQSCPHVSRSRDALRKHVSYRHQEQYNIKKRKKMESML
ncbi:hypothetical protein RI129_009683 [Pyrocoelia pectoralis]|uniref:Uncharacterized protein n=1 Tax=Pyrocoelia pectoralis TaxID=417401 RepID=A0AAN7ZIE9_9COLE